MEADKRQKLEMMASKYGFKDRLSPYFALLENLAKFREQLLARRGHKSLTVFGLESHHTPMAFK